MINQISLIPINKTYTQPLRDINKALKSENQSSSLSTSNIPLYALKSNFLQSFGAKAKKKEDFIEVTDRESGEKVKLSVEVHENICMGNLYFGNYKVKDGKKTLAYIDVDFEPETEQKNVGCEVTHLRTIDSEKYKGLGTELIKLAIKKSYEHGNGGNLFLHSERGFDFSASTYHSNESPIPFYHKIGFKAFTKADQEKIDRWVETNPNMLPDSMLLYLTDESRDKYLKEMCLI